MPINGNLTMFCIFTLRSPSWKAAQDTETEEATLWYCGICGVCWFIKKKAKDALDNQSAFGFDFPFRQCLHELKYLSEPLEMQYEHIRQRPEAELNAALLQLLAVGTAPGIVWGQLKHTHTHKPEQRPSGTSSNHTAYKNRPHTG